MKYYLAENATVYTEARSTSPVLTELGAGDEIEVAEPNPIPYQGWDVVTLQDGKTGYISAKTKAHTRPPGSQPALPPQQESDSARSPTAVIFTVIGVALILLAIITRTLSGGLARGLDFGNPSLAMVLGGLLLLIVFIARIVVRKGGK
jgi:hypothetical protein